MFVLPCHLCMCRTIWLWVPNKFLQSKMSQLSAITIVFFCAYCSQYHGICWRFYKPYYISHLTRMLIRSNFWNTPLRVPGWIRIRNMAWIFALKIFLVLLMILAPRSLFEYDRYVDTDDQIIFDMSSWYG